MVTNGLGDVRVPHVYQASPRLRLLRPRVVAKHPEPEEVSSSSTVLTVRFVTVIVTEMIHAQVKAKSMANYNLGSASDMRRFQRDLKKQVVKAAEDGVKKKLGPTLSRRLKVEYDGASKVELSGPDHLIEQAKKKLS